MCNVHLPVAPKTCFDSARCADASEQQSSTSLSVAMLEIFGQLKCDYNNPQFSTPCRTDRSMVRCPATLRKCHKIISRFSDISSGQVDIIAPYSPTSP